jgi:hypothetical protein
MRLHRNGQIESSLGAPKWPGFMFAQAVPGASGSSSAADACEGHERAWGRSFCDNCLVRAAASWLPRRDITGAHHEVAWGGTVPILAG